MRKIVLAVVLTAILGVGWNAAPVQSADATTAWNEQAHRFAFSDYPGALQYSTFEHAYFGDNFSADFAGILSAVAQTMGTAEPPWGGNEPFSYIENWPDS